jgi:hypothetical protein
VQSAQVSVWVPIVVGLIGVVGVLLGQVLSTVRERRHDTIRARREIEREQRRDRREDELYWRERRIAVGVDLLITLNTWRELAVDSWQEMARDGEATGETLAALSEAVIRLSDQLAHVRLVGSQLMGSTAATLVTDLLATSRETRDALEAASADRPDLAAASARLSADVRRIRDVFRAELGVPDGSGADPATGA